MNCETYRNLSLLFRSRKTEDIITTVQQKEHLLVRFKSLPCILLIKCHFLFIISFFHCPAYKQCLVYNTAGTKET